MTEHVLELAHFGIGFGNKDILIDVNLKIPVTGMVVLMGPGGTGKSTLLRTLSGINFASPSLRTWGRATYLANPFDEHNTPELVAQKARLLMASVRENVIYELPERNSLTLVQQKEVASRFLHEGGLDELVQELDTSVAELPLGLQRQLAILRTMAANPKLIMVDEPTADIPEQNCERIIDYLRKEAQRRAILVVVHNQQHARKLGGTIALLAGGIIQESSSAEDFLSAPQTQAARDFVRTGSCCVPLAEVTQGDEEAVSPPLPASPSQEPAASEETPPEHYVSDVFGPRNFMWLKKGLLGGTPRPGLFVDLDYDLAALQRVGVKVLISLTTQPIEAEALKPFDIEGIWFPIVDMKSPDPEEARKMCERVDHLISNNKPVAYHCRAGMGRTGTMLASQLIWEGHSAMEALEMARKIEPRWVQSEEQVKFLNNFSEHLQKCAKPNKQAASSAS